MLFDTFSVQRLPNWLVAGQSTEQSNAPSFGQYRRTTFWIRNRDIWLVLKLSSVWQLVKHLLGNWVARISFHLLIDNRYKLLYKLFHLVMRLLQSWKFFFLLQSRLLSGNLVSNLLFLWSSQVLLLKLFLQFLDFQFTVSFVLIFFRQFAASLAFRFRLHRLLRLWFVLLTDFRRLLDNSICLFDWFGLRRKCRLKYFSWLCRHLMHLWHLIQFIRLVIVEVHRNLHVLLRHMLRYLSLARLLLYRRGEHIKVLKVDRLRCLVDARLTTAPSKRLRHDRIILLEEFAKTLLVS